MTLIYALLALVKLVGAAAVFSNSTTSIVSPTTVQSSLITAKPSSSGSCGSCTIQGGDVQVYWWPTASDGGQITTQIIDAANNFTFNSPSIYVAFSTLYTENACGTGSVIPATTLSFLEGILSVATGWRWDEAAYTTRAPRVDSAYTLATFVRNQLETCSYTTTSFLQPLTGQYENDTFPDIAALSATYGTTDPASYSQYTVSYNPCSPTLSAPPQIYTMEPDWASCVDGIQGLWDPPYALSAGAVISGFETTSVEEVATSTSSTTTSAVQGSTPSSAIVAPTSTAVVAPTTTQETVAPETQSSAQVEPTSTSVQDTADPKTQSSATPKESTTLISQNAPVPTTAISSTTPFVVIGSQTITAGGASVTLSGTLVSLQTDGSSLIVGSQTLAVTSLTSSSTVPILAIGSQTLSAGSAITLTDASGASSVVSLQAGGSSVVVGGSTIPVAQLSGLSTVAIPTATYAIGSQTLVPGGPAVTITNGAGTEVVSLQAGGSSVVVGGGTIPVAQLSGLTAVSEAKYAIGTQTLVAGASAITITDAVGTHTVSLQAGGSSIVVDGSTIPASQFAGLTSVTASAIATYIIGGQTLTPGASGTIVTDASGTRTVSLEAGGASVVVGGSTFPVGQLSGVTTASAGIGNVLLSMGGYATTTPGGSGTINTSTSSRTSSAKSMGEAGPSGTLFTGNAPQNWGSRGMAWSAMLVVCFCVVLW